MQVVECPQCGAPAVGSARACGYCKADFFITSVAYLGGIEQGAVAKYLKYYSALARQDPNNAEAHLGLGITYLHVGMWPLAAKAFERVMEMSPEVPQAYLYWSMAKIAGRRLMTLPLNDVRQIESHLSTAIQISPEMTVGKLLLALLKTDYFEANGMRVGEPSSAALTSEIGGKEVNRTEMETLRKCVRIGDVSCFDIVNCI